MNTNEAQIEILLDVVTATGGSPLTSYSVEIDDGTGYVPYVGDDSRTPSLNLAPIATGLQSGK